MTESEFNEKVDDTLLAVEETLDDAVSDLDYVTVGGVLTITCENGQKLIFTRQAPVQQLWLATPDGGFHFDVGTEGDWLRDSDQLPLTDFLDQAMQQYADEDLDFSF